MKTNIHIELPEYLKGSVLEGVFLEGFKDGFYDRNVDHSLVGEQSIAWLAAFWHGNAEGRAVAARVFAPAGFGVVTGCLS